jgi:4-alpha-glucanotransferase
MTSKPSARTSKTDEFGIVDGFEDAGDEWQSSPAASVETIREIMRSAGADGASTEHGPVVLRVGQKYRQSKPFDVFLEGGARLERLTELPSDLPIGYHEIVLDGKLRRLIVAPERCYLPEHMRIWGWSAQLYSLRSERSWGMGDLGDLKELARWSAELGAKIVLVNPLGADTPGKPCAASPYSPSSRCFRNLLFLSIADVPGADLLAEQLMPLVKKAATLNKDKTIDRDAILDLKLAALEMLWRHFKGDAKFDAFVAEQGALLQKFCAFNSLAEVHGRDWRAWPPEFRQSESAAVDDFVLANEERVRFHAWVQWLIDLQMAAAASECLLMQDFPIGVEPGGADAWIWQDVFARGVSAGVPPDLYNQAGQCWGLNVFIPHKLRAANYEPFIQTVRALLRHAGGLRIDHVMGLFRLFWIPEGMKAPQGVFVHYPIDDLLAIVALESHRAKAFIVGEDLGTLEPTARKRFAENRLLSYRLMWFEAESPEDWPREALAAISTHDLPTVAGLWTGQDERDEATAGIKSHSEGWQGMRENLSKLTGLKLGAPAEEMVLKAHESLSTAPSVVVTASLEDAMAVLHRPNMPNTIDTWPNWSQPLPGGLEALKKSALAKKIAKALNARGDTEASTAKIVSEKTNGVVKSSNETDSRERAGRK